MPLLPRANHARRATDRRTTSKRGYGWRWQQRRKAFLRAYPLCGQRPNGAAPVMSECHDKGWYTPAIQVDHVIPHRGNDALMWDEGNWQSLCRRCGAVKSAKGL